jgi:predicted Zn-dependent peptidase
MSLTVRLPRPAPGPAAPWRFPVGEHTTLPSGLRVIRHDLPGQELAVAVLVLGVTPEAEPASAEGVATIMARTLDEGTALRDGAAVAADMDRHGASYAASVDTSGIYLSMEAPVRFFGSALGLLGEVVTRPAFPAGEIERHVQIRLGELAQERASAASRARMERLAACTTADSRYSRPVGGTESTVRTIDREAVERFYQDRVSPAAATLVLAGDFTGTGTGTGTGIDTATARALGTWNAATVPAAAALPLTGRQLTGRQLTGRQLTGRQPTAAAPQCVVADRPGAVQSQLAFGLTGPDQRSPDWADLLVAVRVLGGGVSSRLSASLREDKGYTYSIYAGLGLFRRGSLFTIDAAVQADATAAAIAEILAVTSRFHADGPTAAECGKAVDYLTSFFPLRHQTAKAVAASAAAQVGYGLGDSYLDDLQRAFRAVTPDSAGDAFRAHVDPSLLTLAAVGDSTTITSALSSTIARETTVLPALPAPRSIRVRRTGRHSAYSQPSWALRSATDLTMTDMTGHGVMGGCLIEITIPVYNEEKVLAASIARLHAYLTAHLHFPFIITIADNASTDGTLTVAQRLQADLPHVRAVHLDLKGRGRALRQVWSGSEADIVAYMDVDLSTSLDAFLPLIAPLLSAPHSQHSSDLAVGTRLAPGAQVTRGPKREIAQCGFKAARADVIKALLPRIDDEAWFFDTELLMLAQREGFRICEIPVTWVEDRDSKVEIVRTVLADLKGMARLRFPGKQRRAASTQCVMTEVELAALERRT